MRWDIYRDGIYTEKGQIRRGRVETDAKIRHTRRKNTHGEETLMEGEHTGSKDKREKGK